MATKTVVCPECGAPAAPGRYACAQCGALLAAVAMQPRELTTLAPDATDEAQPASWSSAPDEASVAADVTDPGFDTSPELDLPPMPPALGEMSWPATSTWPPAAEPERDGAPAWPPAPAPQRPGEPTWPGASAYGSPPAPAPELAGSPALAASIAAPEVRTPAGSYLPPSAVLPPLDGPSVAMAGAGVGVAPSVGEAPPAASAAARSSGRRLPALGDLFDRVETPAHLTRRTVGVGAAIAAISLLLPWINGLPGAGFTGYLDRWGLAGPGLWIVFLAAAALGAIALGSGRTATWPVGLAAVVFGSLVLGLVWPSVFGGGGAIGIWFAFVGALVLVVGGALDLRARHALPDSTV